MTISRIRVLILFCIVSLVLLSLYPITSNTAWTSERIRYVENNYKLILSTVGDFALFSPPPSIGEKAAFTQMRTNLYSLGYWLTARDKEVSLFDVYSEIWTHDYNLTWLHNTVLSEITNAPGGGALIAFGHTDPYNIMVYRFEITWSSLHYIEFPYQWSIPSCVTITSSEVGNIVRSKPIWEMPALVIIIGCESGGDDEPAYSGQSWLWAFKFDDGDYPYYWYGRGFIGFLTDVWYPNLGEAKAYQFVKKVLELAIDQGRSLGDAVKEASDAVGYSVYMDYVIGWRRYQEYIDQGSSEVALFVGGYYTEVDPTFRDELIDTAIKYLQVNYPELYSIITKYGIKPTVEEILTFKSIGYKKYTVSWSIKGKISVIVKLVSNGVDHVVIGFNARIVSPDKVMGSSDVDSLVDKVKKEYNDTIAEIEKYGFTLKEGTVRCIEYNGTRVVFLQENDICSANLYLDMHKEPYLWILYSNDLLLLKRFIKDNWVDNIRWVINEDEALNIALRNVNIYGKYNYTIEKLIMVTSDGLYPYYRVSIIEGDRKNDVYINALNGDVLAAMEFYRLRIDFNEPKLIDMNVVYAFILIIVVTIVLGILRYRIRYRK